jgi:hypothetical protein
MGKLLKCLDIIKVYLTVWVEKKDIESRRVV